MPPRCARVVQGPAWILVVGGRRDKDATHEASIKELQAMYVFSPDAGGQQSLRGRPHIHEMPAWCGEWGG